MIKKMPTESDNADTSKTVDIKETVICCQGGYGYMKRRLGLLSYETDKIMKKKEDIAEK